jgi:tRNA threonylcarbamoyladenosine biosynthesis protein TsaB
MPARALLVLDTATETMHLGVQNGARVLVREEAGGALASAALLPSILSLLREAGLAPAQLTAIATGRGPGAFTGVRTACSVAQGLAFGAGVPVIAIDTLLAIAQDALAQGASPRIWAMQDARMGEIYAGFYEFAGGAWRVVSAPALYAPEALREHIARAPSGVTLAGNALSPFGDVFAPLSLPSMPQAQPRAAALLSLANAACERAEFEDAAAAVPLYVRDKVALTTEERDAQRAAATTSSRTQ